MVGRAPRRRVDARATVRAPDGRAGPWSQPGFSAHGIPPPSGSLRPSWPEGREAAVSHHFGGSEECRDTGYQGVTKMLGGFPRWMPLNGCRVGFYLIELGKPTRLSGLEGTGGDRRGHIQSRWGFRVVWPSGGWRQRLPHSPSVPGAARDPGRSPRVARMCVKKKKFYSAHGP